MNEDNEFELDEMLFGDGPVFDHFPQGNELQWGTYFINDRESGAGPDVLNYTNEALLEMGFSSEEISEKLKQEADALFNRIKDL